MFYLRSLFTTMVAVIALASSACVSPTDPSESAQVTGEALSGKAVCWKIVGPNLLLNAGFEKGPHGPDAIPKEWSHEAWEPTAVFAWDRHVSHDGRRSVRITAETPNDASWTQVVPIESNKLYRLSGWVRTDSTSDSGPGANLSLYGAWDRSSGVVGTSDWTYQSLVFNSADQTQVTIAARLGAWAGTVSGTAWFDDLRLEEVTAQDPKPAWRIQVLIYPQTDFQFTDSSGVNHHMVAGMTDEERDAAARQATLFVQSDLPSLTGGHMVATVNVRSPTAPLSQLTPCGAGWSPGPEDTTLERDSTADSVIVYWDPRAVDQTTGQSTWIGCAAGLTWNMGTNQTYNAQIIESAVAWWATPNVLRHEFGHSILYFSAAVGVAPKPSVDNHANADSYVHCPSGEPYIWTEDGSVPNSIYNVDSGFTHDYYSGTTATADQPSRCLGVTPDAWAYGGPATLSGVGDTRDPESRIHEMRGEIDAMAESCELSDRRAQLLKHTLRTAAHALEHSAEPAAIMALRHFMDDVDFLTARGLLPKPLGALLVAESSSILRGLCR